jgi:hypothetical protein
VAVTATVTRLGVCGAAGVLSVLLSLLLLPLSVAGLGVLFSVGVGLGACALDDGSVDEDETAEAELAEALEATLEADKDTEGEADDWERKRARVLIKNH